MTACRSIARIPEGTKAARRHVTVEAGREGTEFLQGETNGEQTTDVADP
jgi:hypothetical protein